MAASNTRDVSLIIKARDEATKTFDSVAAALQKLVESQSSLNTGGNVAQTRLADFTKILLELDKAAASTSSKFDTAASSMAAMQQRAVENSAKLEDLNRQATSLSRVVELLSREADKAFVGPRRNGLVDALRASKADLQSLNREMTSLSNVINRDLSGASKSTSQLQQIASTERAIADAATNARTQVDTLTEALKRQSAEQDRLARAGSVASSIERTTGLNRPSASDNGATFGELEQQLKRTSQEAQKVRDSLDPVSAAIAKAAVEEKRLNDLYAQGALSADHLTQAQQRLSQQLQTTVAGLDGSAAAAARSAESQRLNAEAIRAAIAANTGLNRPSASDNGAGYGALQAQAEKSAAAAKSLEAALNPLKASQNAYNQELRDARLLFESGAISARTYAQARREIGQRAQESRDQITGAAEANLKLAQSEREAARGVEELRRRLDPVANILALERQEMEKLTKWQREGRISATEYANAQKLVAEAAKQATLNLAQSNSNAPKISLFGLRPYETQNLLFQVNDIVTQLGSGTSLSQTLAQQGGQIFQLFQNRIGPSIAAAFSNPYFLGAAAVMAGFLVAVKGAVEESSRLREITGQLTVSSDGGLYDAQKLSDATVAFRDLGISAEAAMDVVRKAVARGVSQDDLAQFAKAARDLADVMGIDLKEASTAVTDSFTRGFAAIETLDQKYNFLTASQREHIRALFDEGEATQARAEALDIFSAKMDSSADKARSQWTDAVRSLSGAWASFKEVLGDTTFIKDVTGAMTTLGLTISNLIDRMKGLRTATTVLREIAAAEVLIKQLTDTPGIDFFGLGARRLKNAKEDLADLRKELATLTNSENGGQGGAASTAATEAQLKADARIREASQAALAQERLISREKRLQLAIEKAGRDAADAGASEAGIAEAKKTAEVRERAKLQREIAAESDKAAAAAKAAGTMEALSFKIIADFEKFRAKAYWDVNAWRTGYGSDTTTDAQGRVRSVTQNTVVDKEGATRDLERRIKEFSDTVKRQIGSERYGAFSPEQQASLNSVAYNYGSLPERILGAVRKGSAQEIATAIRGLGGDNAGINRKRRNQEAAIFENPNRELEVSTAEIEQQRTDAQEKFNEKLTDENEKRRQSIESLQRQTGLTGEALIEEQKRQAVASAILQKQQEYERLNRERATKGLAPIEASKEELAEVERNTRAYENLARAKDVANARRTEIDNPVRDLTAQRDAIQQQIKYLSEQGNTGGASALGPQLADVNSRLTEAIEKAKAFYAELANNPQAMANLGLTAEGVKNIALGLQNAQVQAQSLGYVMGYSLDSIAQKFTGAVVNAVDKFAQKVAAGENVFKSLKDAFLQFASDFLRQIAQMILQQTVFNLISGVLKGIGGGAAGVPANHSGGLASGSGMVRGGINPAIFNNAMRLHTGGIAGLGPNEVPRILERDEEVLTRSDPRHILNGGKNGKGGAAPVVNVSPKIINTIDPGEMMSEAMNTRVGQKAILNMVSENRDAFKQAMG